VPPVTRSCPLGGCGATAPGPGGWAGATRVVIPPLPSRGHDDRAHIRALIATLSNRRAIRIEGRPVFLVYRAKDLPKPKQTAEVWRREVERAGLPGLYLIAVETSWDTNWDATRHGFDAKVVFQPQWGRLGAVPRVPIPGKPDLRVYEYDRAWQAMAAPPAPVSYRRYPTVAPGWDNSARVGDRAVLLHGATPAGYGRWLRHAIDQVRAAPPDHQVVFINAWNEWAEGAYLEPDARFGATFLEETRRVMAGGVSPAVTQADLRPATGAVDTAAAAAVGSAAMTAATATAPVAAARDTVDLPIDRKYYWATYPEAILSCRDPRDHYLSEGWKRGFKPNPRFDPTFYLATYPDVAAAGVEPLTHFVTAGLREGRAGSRDDVRIEQFDIGYRIPRGPLPDPPPIDDTVRAIAFHLPQFHPIPENDRWWGKGFTEWSNVRRGRPQFRGHYQPHVPDELGYYDLRDQGALERQADLAREHGIYGFCFYYYWFAGKVLLELPLRRAMAARPAFPFCLCWANENWTRRWDGRESEILIAQEHSPDDDVAFIRNIEPVLRHRDYIRIGGRPLLLVYRPALLPDARATTGRWRQYLRECGLGEVYLAMTQTFFDNTKASDYGFDAVVQFPPHANTTPVTTLIEGRRASFRGTVYDYEQTKRAYLRELLSPRTGAGLLPGVMPSWDNTARRLGHARVWVNASPESYCDWLATAAAHLRQQRVPEERLVFINAWNEWAEGCHLEPDRKFRRAWLNATRLGLRSPDPTSATTATTVPATTTATAAPAGNGSGKGKTGADPHRTGGSEPLRVAFVSHDAYPHGAQYCLLTLTTWLKEAGLVTPYFLLAGPGPLTEDFARVGPVLALDRVLANDGGGNGTAESDDAAVRVIRAFCGPRPDAVYINSAAAAHVCRVTRRLGVPHVAHVHEMETSIRRWVGQAKMRLLRDSAAVVIAASKAVAANLRTRHRIAAERVRVVYESIRCTGVRAVTSTEKQNLRRWLGLPPDGHLFLGCGTTDARKGPDLFLEVAARVRGRTAGSVHFVWVGAETRPGERAALRARAAETGLGDVVSFHEAVDTPLPYMLAADAFVLPSREDPFPLVCLEAADCGLPIVCFRDAGGMPDFVGSDCGAVVPHSDVGRMAGRLVWLSSDKARLQAFGERARSKVRQQFDVSVKGREIYEALRTAVQQGFAPPTPRAPRRTISRAGAREAPAQGIP
jgi:lipopolysaccharide biosynthesis protein/glycosyltransferase involved in cell wall biosynthesis